MQYLFGFFVFVLGLFVGSFLNCVIYRLERGRGFVAGRSFCPKCRHKLGFWDLIPLFSFVALKGRCRYCKKPISAQYPAVEILTGLIFLLIFNFQFSIFNEFSITNLQFSNTIYLFYLLIISSLLVIVFVYDLKTYLIPDQIIYSAIGLVFFYRLFENFNIENWGLIENWFLKIENLKAPLFSAVIAALFFFLIWIVSRGKWMGLGDAKLGFLIGLFLGWPNILPALFWAFFLGAGAGIILIILGKKKLKSEVPFGPFLVAGTFIALFWGRQMVEWYLKLI